MRGLGLWVSKGRWERAPVVAPARLWGSTGLYGPTEKGVDLGSNLKKQAEGE